MKKFDVIIIGGGWSGILACKFMVENNLNCIVLEGENEIGGVWKYRENNKSVGGVMKSTKTTSSKTMTEMSDFPMPESYSPFPNHKLVYAYLNNYIDHFNIRDKFLTNTKVIRAKKIKDYWYVWDQHKNRYQCKNLIITSGVHQFPDHFYLQDERFAEAKIKLMHSCAYKRITDEFFDKNIIIYGGGETASDIGLELTHAANKIFMCIPHGQWFISRFSPIYAKTNNDKWHPNYPFVMDTYSSRLRRLIDPMRSPHAGQWVVELWKGKCGSGIKEWETEAPYFGQFLNKSDDILTAISYGSVIPKRDIKTVKDKTVYFSDGTQEEIDIIIFCSGYKTAFPFLKSKQYLKTIDKHFKYVFDNDDPSLAYIGFARPVVGSIPGLAELQSLYVGKIFSKKLQLPSKEERSKIIEQDKNKQNMTFSKTTHRIRGLVNHALYSDQLAGLAGIRPNFWKLFFKNPKNWFIAVTSPHNNTQYLLHDEKKHHQIFQTLKRHWGDSYEVLGFVELFAVNLFPWLFLRKKKGVRAIYRNAYLIFLWIIFSPVLVYRILFHPERHNRF